MEKPDQRVAVGNAPAQGDLAGYPQGTAEVKRVQAVSVEGHHAGKTAVAAKDQPAEFTRSFAAGEVRWTEAEVKPRTNFEGCVAAPIVQSLPVRVFVKPVAFAIHDQLIQPKLAAAVIMLHHVEQSKTIERGSVDFVARLQVHDQFFAIELSGDGTIGAVRRGTDRKSVV